MTNDKRHMLPDEVAQRTVFPGELTPENVLQKLASTTPRAGSSALIAITTNCMAKTAPITMIGCCPDWQNGSLARS